MSRCCPNFKDPPTTKARAMFYAIFVPRNCDLPQDETERPLPEQLVFEHIKDAKSALKRYQGSRMKTFSSREKAISFLNEPGQDESFVESDLSYNQDALITSLEKLTLQQSPRASGFGSMGPPPSPRATILNPASAAPPSVQLATTNQITDKPAPDEAEPAYPTPKPAQLAQLRRKIEAGDYEAVEQTIWSNPRCLVSPCDSIINLMAGPKYNACHIAAKANKADIMALLLDTMSNFSFLRKLYPRESDANIQDRVNHLLDSYLNTPDRLQGNTPLHFACKLGHYRVVRVLLTFEGCDLTLRDIDGKTAEESTCSKYVAPPPPPPPKPASSSPVQRSPSEEEAISSGGGGGEQSDMNNTSLGLNGSLAPQCDNETTIRNKIRSMFKHQLHLPLFRDQLKKRLMLEKRRHRASSQMDSDTSFSDLDESFILNSPTKSTQ